MNKITKLTKEQEAQIPIYFERYLTKGLDTSNTNETRTAQLIKDYYKVNNLKEPIVIFLDSPLLCNVFINLLKNTGLGSQLEDQLKDQLEDQLKDQFKDQFRRQLGDQLWNQLGDKRGWQLWNQIRRQLGDQLWNQLGDQLGGKLRGQLREQLKDQFRDQLGDQLRGQLRNQLGDQLGDQLGNQLWNQLWTQLRNQLGDQLKDQLGDQLKNQLEDQLWNQLKDKLGDQLEDKLEDKLGDQLRDKLGGQFRDQPKRPKLECINTWFGGQFDNYWLCFYNYIQEVLNVKLDSITKQKFDLFTSICEEVNLFYPYKDICILSKKPIAIRRDSANRLHSVNSLALEFKGGTGIYAINGVRVPEFIIKSPEIITSELIDKESNAEVRRVMINIFGQEKYLVSGKYEVLDTDKDQYGRPRRLLRKKLTGDEDIVKVEVINSSPELDNTYKTYYLPVHPELRPLINPEKRIFGAPQKMTCHNAVASTFGERGEDYKPFIET